jgi:uncharacterized protein (TIGR02001 family)
MKKHFLITAALIASLATTALAEDKVTGSAYVAPTSKYIFRGLDLSDNQWVVQGGVDLNYKNFTLSYWSNMQTRGTANYKRSDLTETDITLNYSYTPIELLTFNVGNTYYSFDSATVLDTNELYLKTTLNTLLSPTFAAYWDWDESTKTGMFYTLSVGHTFELMKTLGLNLGALASYNLGNPSASVAYNKLHNYELSAGLDYTLTDKIKISPSFLYSNAFNKTAREAGVHHEGVVSIKTAFIF